MPLACLYTQLVRLTQHKDWKQAKQLAWQVMVLHWVMIVPFFLLGAVTTSLLVNY